MIELGTGDRDPTLLKLFNAPIKTQKIYVNNLVWNDITYDVSVRDLNRTVVHSCIVNRIFSRNRVNLLFISLCIDFPKLIKEDECSSHNKPVSWTLNENYHFISLFSINNDPDLMDSINRICDELQVRSELNKKNLRKVDWKHIPQRYHDRSWSPTDPRPYMYDILTVPTT